ncbi:hypothetical protein NLX71_26165 [Paenibacillus sp. MZ04-78.2]|uniref:hypothetical protein n=1 Tax=Paenibacillus sp. MZ04-78.2 TaxID=2962034 RepID=UPI0020B8691E|nr:hypothetical protein [Paenibacillus sp. MZ04-78.2]MCP3776727.1 hypothetical protein [Paenibacillus sp. MZ04-78.2]
MAIQVVAEYEDRPQLLQKKNPEALLEVHFQQLKPEHSLTCRLKVRSNTAKLVTAIAFVDLAFCRIACGCIRLSDFLLFLLIG